jgi:hypothetical protein
MPPVISSEPVVVEAPVQAVPEPALVVPGEPAAMEQVPVAPVQPEPLPVVPTPALEVAAPPPQVESIQAPVVAPTPAPAPEAAIAQAEATIERVAPPTVTVDVSPSTEHVMPQPIHERTRPASAEQILRSKNTKNLAPGLEAIIPEI